MARLFKPKYPKRVHGVAMRDTKGRPVYQECTKWYIEYRDASDRVRRVAGFTDKVATRQRAAELERQAAREASGLIDSFAEHRRRPLAEHLADWHTALLAKGNTAAHADKQASRAGRIIDGCRFRMWPDVSASHVQRFVAGLRSGTKPISTRTANYYLQAVKGFCGWMVQDRRAADSPLAHLRAGSTSKDEKRERRAFTDDELRALIHTTEHGPERYGLSGPVRALCYRLVVETGLRQNETRTLTADVFDLTAGTPSVTVRAAYSKNGRADTLPVRPGLAAALVPVVNATPDGGRVFGLPERRHNVIAMLRADMSDARAAWTLEAQTGAERREREESDFLAYCDAAGRFADFHALRHTFITNLARGGTAPKVAMDLARHSDVNLTMRCYSHTVVTDRARALDVLPDLIGKPAVRERVTGTDGAPR